MSLEDDLRQLSSIPLFAALEHEARRLLAFSAETRILNAGEALFRKGERSDCGYFLLSGLMEIEPADSHGDRKLIRPPVLIGEIAMLLETERPATIVASEPTTLLKITRSLFQRVLREHPRSASQTRQLIESRLIAFARDMDESRRRNFQAVSGG